MKPKRFEYFDEFQAMITGTITPARKGRGPSMEHAGGEPDEDAECEIESCLITISGVQVDIEPLLTRYQLAQIRERAFEKAEED